MSNPMGQQGEAPPISHLSANRFLGKRALQSAKPSVLVRVGDRTYEHYAPILAAASERLDLMIADATKALQISNPEGASSGSVIPLIELKNRDPREWEMIYNFLEPAACPTVTSYEEAEILRDWANFLQLHDLMKELRERAPVGYRPPPATSSRHQGQPPYYPGAGPTEHFHPYHGHYPPDPHFPPTYYSPHPPAPGYPPHPAHHTSPYGHGPGAYPPSVTVTHPPSPYEPPRSRYIRAGSFEPNSPGRLQYAQSSAPPLPRHHAIPDESQMHQQPPPHHTLSPQQQANPAGFVLQHPLATAASRDTPTASNSTTSAGMRRRLASDATIEEELTGADKAENETFSTGENEGVEDGMKVPSVDDIKDRRAKKNAAARERAARVRERLIDIRARSEDTWTEEERHLVNQQEARRAAKNIRSKERAMERKEMLGRIMSKPEEKRTKGEVHFLHTIMIAKEKKNKGDRARRIRKKQKIGDMDQNGGISNNLSFGSTNSPRSTTTGTTDDSWEQV